MQCEFNNVFTTNTSQVVVTEKTPLIDAVSFRSSELIKVPAELFAKFPQLKHVDVELTQMKEISADDFRNANELKYFLARFNQIEELKNGIFTSCPQLKYIVLQYNLISRIDSKAFEGLNSLEAVYLDYNKITNLPAEVLDPLPSLLHFSVAYNNMTTLPDNLFKRNDKVETLNFGHNLLASFPDEQFENLPNLERVQLDHNKLRSLDLRTCKSTEIVIDKNEIETLELNKWTRFVSAWENPINKFVLHEHYGTGRNYNFSFSLVNEITFFVNENCCTTENLENFFILIQSFGDLNQKGFDVHDWRCKFLKTIGYETHNGFVVNNVCNKILDIPATSFSPVEKSTEPFDTTIARSTGRPLSGIRNQEDIISSDEATPKPRESLEDSVSSILLSPNIFTGLNIETLNEKRTTTEIPTATAYVEEIFPTTEESYEKKCEKGILKTVKTKVVGWKDKAVRKWNDWVG